MSLKKAGKIRAVAVSNLSIEQMQECLEEGYLDGCQPPLNMFERESEKEILPLCQQNQLGVFKLRSNLPWAAVREIYERVSI